ncbi:hypothetical protein VIGAN_02165900 [Vigna angularis var. angularis]|nr:hypothetical protein VIGAN_02165900 [Vigna angularis var. angularis]
MAILGTSKFISFATFLAILLLLLTSALGAAAAHPTIRHGRKLLQPKGYASHYLPIPKPNPTPSYGYIPGYPGGGGYNSPRP